MTRRYREFFLPTLYRFGSKHVPPVGAERGILSAVDELIFQDQETVNPRLRMDFPYKQISASNQQPSIGFLGLDTRIEFRNLRVKELK